MSTDLRDQLRSYGEHWDESLDLWSVEEIVTRESSSRGRQPRLTVMTRRPRPLAIVAASALLVLGLIGGVLLLLGPGPEPDPVSPIPSIAPTEPVPIEPPITEVPDSQPPITEAPVTESSMVAETTTPPSSTIASASSTTEAVTPTSIPAPSPVTYFTSADGLPDGYPVTVTVAADGNVWAAVPNPDDPDGPCRLARFDRAVWTTFEPETGCVTALFPAPGTGVIAAVLTTDGELRLIEFDGATWVDHHEVHGLPPIEEPVAKLLDDGTLVIASHHFGPPDRLGLSLLTYDGASWQVSRELGLMGWRAAWASIAIDSSGDAWFVDHHDGIVVRLSHDRSRSFELAEPSVMWITATPAGDLWATDGALLYRFDGSAWVTHEPGDGLVPPSTRTIPSSSGEFTQGYGLGFGTEGDGGQFWISEPEGASVYRNGAWEDAADHDVPDLGFGFRAAVVQGPDGSTWVVTPRGEVYRFFDGEWTKFSVRASSVEDPSAIAIDPSGSAWFIDDQSIGRITPEAVIADGG